MKIEYLQKIIARIQNQIHCPKCRAPFNEDTIEIRGIKGHQVEFSAECGQCSARSQISAEISGPEIKPLARGPVSFKKQLSGLELPAKPLEVSQLEPLKNSLKSFKGRDVRTLFE